MDEIETTVAVTTILKKISPEARDRLIQKAHEIQADEDDLIAFVIENAFAPIINYDDADRAEDQAAIAEADAGGPFVRGVGMQAWFKSRSEGKREPVPEATIYVT